VGGGGAHFRQKDYSKEKNYVTVTVYVQQLPDGGPGAVHGRGGGRHGCAGRHGQARYAGNPGYGGHPAPHGSSQPTATRTIK
jgi:hypothetical protein